MKNLNCPRPGKECNEFMCGSSVEGICQEQEIVCNFCDKVYDESELNSLHPMDRDGFLNCVTYDKEDDTFCLWHECEDDYYTGNIMEINYCPRCGRRLKDATD